ncbi:signal recognition particle protein [Aphelenchoides avenae]|nr:signal recognition particle protein [Aphelenchus avenae]
MTYFTNWEEFAKAAERLYDSNPEKCRFVTKYMHKDGKLVLKMTDDVTCVQYGTDQLQDLKRLEKLVGTIMRNATSK